VVLTEPRFQVVRFPTVVDPAVVAGQAARVTEGFLKAAVRAEVLEPMYPPAGGGPPAADPLKHYYVLVDAPGGAGGNEGLLRLAASAVDRQGRSQLEKGGTAIPASVGDEQMRSALLVKRVVELAAVAMNFSRAADEGAVTAVKRFKDLISTGFNVKTLLQQLGEFGKVLQRLPPDLMARRLSSDPNHPLYNRYLAGPFVVLGGSPTPEEVDALVAQSDSLGVTRPFLRPSPHLWVGLASRRVSEIASDPGVLDRFTARFRLNPRLQLAGIPVPGSEVLVREMARMSEWVGNPIGRLSDVGDQMAAVIGALNSVPLLSSALVGDFQPILYPGAHTLVRVNHNDRPLVIVPGFAASLLHMDGKERWLGKMEELLFNRIRSEMDLRPDGTPVMATEVTDVLRYLIKAGPLEAEPIYGAWMEHLRKKLGYVEYDQGFANSDPTLPGRRRRLDGSPVLTQDPVPDLFVFPYDWRLDNQKSAEQLREFVRVVREIHPDADGIDLVGHSNGGLVGRAFLLLPGQRALVRRFISVGTPWLGAPKILAGLVNGQLDDASLNIAGPIGTFRRLLQFYPAAHQLLPSREFFELGARPLLEDGYDVNTNGLGHQTFTFEGYQDVVGRHLLRESAALAGASLSTLPGGVHPAPGNANRFRAQPIADHRDDSPDVETHHIFGMGCTPDTIGQMRLVSRLVPAEPVNNAMLDLATGDVFEPEEEGKPPGALTRISDGRLPLTGRQYRLSKEVELRFVSGDGTVPVASLARGAGSEADLNARHAQIHPLVAGFGEKESGHNPMLNTDQFLRLFSDVITGRTVDHLAVRVSIPTGAEEGSATTFGLSASGGGNNPGELSWVVDFGDGTVELHRGAAGAMSLQHRYRQSGRYTVSVGVTTDKTDTDRPRVAGFSSGQVEVANVPPKVTLDGIAPPVHLGDTRMLTALVTDAGVEDSFSYQWRVDGVRYEGRGQFAVPATFSTPGRHRVEVEVSDQDGGTGTASVDVEVLSSGPASEPTLVDRARPPRSAALQSLPGFPGGQPEILVRLTGVQGVGDSRLETPALVTRSERDVPAIVDQILDLKKVAIPTVLGVLADPSTAWDALNGIRTAPDRFIGKYAKDVEMVREVRARTVSIPLLGNLASLAGQDLSVKRSWVAGWPKSGAWMMDVMYLKGGAVQRLYRWSNSVAPGVAFRLRWDWVAEEGRVEFLSAGPVLGDLLSPGATVLSNAAPVFATANPAMAADRLGPAVCGVLNPATDRVQVVARDNFTPATGLPLYLGFDANENGRLDDDVFYELESGDLPRSRLTSRPFAILSQDEQGNIGDLDPFIPIRTRNFLMGESTLPPVERYRARLTAVREAVRGAVADALQDPVTRRFLLEPGHLWLFEQGSGAGLWRSEDMDEVVALCNGNYVPGKSDNDYEVFLPTRTGWAPTLDPAARGAFLGSRPLNETTMAGDWYFRRPLGADLSGNLTDDPAAVTHWVYRLPDGFALPNGDVEFVIPKVGPGQSLSVGLQVPMTPAEVIASVMRSKIGDQPDGARLLPDATFYAERQEYLTYGKGHISRPQAAGDDTLGDAGMGRQLLMLKWSLEGAFVTAPAIPGLNASLPQAGPAFLDSVHGQWKLSGVPLAEGYEWGVFQEFAALSAHPTSRAGLRFGPPDRPVLRRFADDALAAKERAKIKKLGKAAIRAALARLAGDDRLSPALGEIDRARYRSLGLRSFEEYILATIRGNADARSVFGALVEDRDDREFGPDLGDWLRAKQGHDEAYFQLLLSDPALHRRYVTETFRFLRQTVQLGTRSAYDADIQRMVSGGMADEASQRLANLHRVIHGAPGQEGLLDLARSLRVEAEVPVEVSSWGPDGFRGVDVEYREPGPAGPNTVPRRRASVQGTQTLLSQGAVTAMEEEVLGNESGEAIAQLHGDLSTVLAGEPVLSMTVASGPVQQPTDDDDLFTLVESMPVGSPVVASDPVLALFATGPNRPQTVLYDWPAAGAQPRSPATTLGLADRVEVMLMGRSGMTGLEALFRTDASLNVLRRRLVEAVPGSGLYELDPTEPAVQLTLSGSDSRRLFVPEENVMQVQVIGAGGASGVITEEVMMDASELAIATVKHSDRADALKPRLDFRDILTVSASGPRMFLQGFHEFRDDIIPLSAGEHGQMRQMIQDFAGPNSAASGEADWLYVHAHGNKAGHIFGHDPFNHASDGVRILDPVADLAVGGRWNRDADYFISEACSILNPGIDKDNRPIPNLVPGLQAWEQVMRGSARPIHGVLGFMFGKVASRQDTRKFIRMVADGQPIGLSWVRSMDGVRREWAWLFHRGTEEDTLYAMRQDPDPAGPIDSLLYRDVFGDDLGDGDEGSAGVEMAPGLWVSPSLAWVPWAAPAMPEWRGATWGSGMDLSRDSRRGFRSEGPEVSWGSFWMPPPDDPGPPPLEDAMGWAREFLGEPERGTVGGWRLDQAGVIAYRRAGEEGASPMGRPVARRLHYRRTVDEVPVLETEWSVDVRRHGVSRASGRRGWLPTDTCGPVKPVLPLWWSVERWWLGRSDVFQPVRILAAELGWAPRSLADGSVRLVPVWNLRISGADSAGGAVGDVEEVRLDAVTGAAWIGGGQP
jgi:hypothetical protein